MSYFNIGKIVNTQGIKGEIKVILLTEDKKRFDRLKSILIFIEDSFKEYEIERIRYHKKFVILKLKNVDSINEALLLKGSLIKIHEKYAIPLYENEYYVKDIYDMKVFNENGEELGIIKDIIETGSNDVYVIKRINKKDLLIPAIKQCILQVDVSSKKMIVKLLKGLDE